MGVRLLLVLSFGGLAFVAVAVLLAMGWLFDSAASEAERSAIHELLVVYRTATGVLVVALVAVAWVAVDRAVAAPLVGLTRDIQTLTHANPDHEIDFAAARSLGELPVALRGMVGELAVARQEVNRLVADATTRADEQKGRLEAILRDLHQGVVVCTLNHHILLYNRRALELLHVSGELGLGRPLFSLTSRQPFLHALQSLTARLGEDDERPQDLTVPFLASTLDGRFTLQGRMSLILDPGGAPLSYVITFDDNTHELAVLGRRDNLLHEASEGLRRPVANLRAAAETLLSHRGMTAAERTAFEEVIANESRALSARLETLADEYRRVITSSWPATDVYSADLLGALVGRLGEDAAIEAVMTGIPHWLRGDSYTLLELMDHLIRKVHESTGATAFDLEAATGEHHVYLDAIWSGRPIAASALESWLDATLTGTPGALTARDIIEHHKSELWSEPHREGFARLRMPLPAAAAPALRNDRHPLPARPEFYDFGLLDRPVNLEKKGGQPLKSLTYVVFDTETTGLKPSEGDEMISIAGVRVVNERILTGESFSRFINPGRPVPRQSTRFHGITDEMVRDMPPARIVLPQFQNFVEGAVLVAHNAAFDVKFLKLKETECGVSFDNPVLDTLLLSVFLHDHTPDHTLEGLAARFGIGVEGRHTALGDALVTAAIFLRMIDLLEAVGVRTLDEAMEASDRMVRVRARQAKF